MPNNVSVNITADVTNLQTQFGIARAESQNLTREFNALARQATEMGPQTEDFQQKLQAASAAMLEAKAATASLSAQLKEAQGIGHGFGTTISEATGFLGQFGVALGAAGAVNFARTSLDYAAGIEHMANVLQMSTDDLQAFHFAARESSVATEDADTMIRRFMSNLGGLADNAGPAVKAIEDLGLTADELSGPPTVAIQKIAIALLNVQDPAQRARIETELFGRAGEDLTAMLSRLALGFDDMRQKATDAGQVLSHDIVDAAEKADVAISNLWTEVKGLGAEIAVGAWQSFKITLEAYGDLFDQLTGKANRAKQAMQLPATAGGLPLDLAKPKMPDAGPAPTWITEEQANKQAGIAQRLAEEIQKAYENEVSESLSDAQRTLTEMQRVDVQETNDYVEEQTKRLSAAIAHLDKEYQYHQISAQEKHDAEVLLTQQILGEAIKRLDAEIATLQKGTELWREEMRKRADLVTQYDAQIQKADDQLVQAEMQKWTQLSNTMVSSVGSAFKELIFQGRSWQQAMLTITEGVFDAFLQMGEKWLENWIENQIASLIETKTTDSAKAIGQITDAAGVAGANAYAQWAAYPPVAAAMAASAVASTMSFTSMVALETGTNFVPRDMPAFLHRGEAVIPARYNNTQNNGGASLNYSPTINAREPASLAQMLTTESSAMLSWINRMARNGSIRI